MTKKICNFLLLVILPLMLTAACDFGKVDQGRVIAYDKNKKAVTMIKDIKAELGKPDYDQLPPMTFTIPEDPAEMGPEPKAGKLMSIDPDKKQIVIFDDATQNFKTIGYTPIDVKKGVSIRDPLVTEKKYPIVNREKKTITVFDKRKRLVTTFTLPEEYFQLPENTFGFGDEVRIYAKVPGKAARLMNISETDIFKK